MKQEYKSNTIAAVGTVVFMVLLFLLLWFVYIHKQEVVEEEGIEVSFGDVMDNGGGTLNEQPAVTPPPTASTPPAASTSSEEVIEEKTQESESPVVIPEDPEKKKKEQERIEAEKKKKEQEEAERKKREQEEAEQKKKDEQTKKAQNLIGGAFSNSGQTSSEEGSGGSVNPGSNMQGNPLGHGSSGGNSWDLKDRNLIGALPKPSNEFNQEGNVVVDIKVDSNGNVIDATVGEGTTVSDVKTRNLAISAAKKAKFSPSNRPNDARGKIVYKFVAK